MDINLEYGLFGRVLSIPSSLIKTVKLENVKNSESKSPPCCITKLMNSSNLRFILETLITFDCGSPFYVEIAIFELVLIFI